MATQTDQHIFDLSARVEKLEQSRKKSQAEISAVQSTMERSLTLLEKLMADKKAVLRRNDDRCILDKDRVYAAAHKAGMNRLDLLRALDEAGLLLKETEEPSRRYTRKARIDGARVRAVIILLNH